MSSSPPWLDLPTPLTEEILERLPLSDYVRFPAVCRGWRSIQADHRRRHAPSPPPMVKLPWLIPCKPQEEMVLCYSPFEDRSYRIPIPDQPNNPYIQSFANGWLLRFDAIVNPISGAVIPFPEPLPLDRPDTVYIAAASPPPDHIIFVVTNGCKLYLCRQGDRDWTRLMLPIKGPEIVTKAVAFGEKLYCISSLPCGPGGLDSKADNLIVIDPLQVPPAVDTYRMADWNTPPLPDGMKRFCEYPQCMVESGGEVLLVREIYELFVGTVGYKVFRPDLMKRMWTRVESLGDRVLILHHIYSVSLLAADAGLKENCIYFSTGLKFEGSGNKAEAPWKVFDLGTGTISEVAFPNASLVEKNTQRMFVPSIC